MEDWLVTGQDQSHQTNSEMVQSSPPEVDAGTDMPLRVRVSCVSSCDLRGRTVRIIAEDGVVTGEATLTGFEEGMNETDDFWVKGPIGLGECTWSILFPGQEVGGVLHEESSTPLVFTVKPHATSMAIWDVPSPVARNHKFKIKVGVKCSTGCKLAGSEIRIYGEKGKKVATETLGDVPWPGTSALYWAEVELDAPKVSGLYKWRGRFLKPDLRLPHEGASCQFTFASARPPEHVVTVEVVAEDTKAAIRGAHVLLREPGRYAYRGYTDEDGVARLEVPKGEYTLYASKDGAYETFETILGVSEDATIGVELPFVPFSSLFRRR
jgi:hypothetical protein